MSSIKSVYVLRSLYKTKYPDQEDIARVPDGQLAIRTHKSSWVSPEDAEWLAGTVGATAHFMAPIGGFGAGCFVNSEMNGLPAMAATVMTDSHYVTVESMQAYKPVLSKLGVPDAVDDIFMKPNFRPILKDANQRSNAIFS